ncbi:hypothetical protein ASPCADRAFT_511396 [Aspergillus carbonarius ITEM 5010]|uniref:Uncharacterized protein n=1 Tax=Aspergillus carbonarius (strain ITEM 5010) TaxID=602072 RepID=A0A1R3S0Z9_ASPC5|nr:hypothetical protein ASPCADRAFT_511396 [Aspergillus carbonarius ITEM 5010]
MQCPVICYDFAKRGSCRYNPCRYAHVRGRDSKNESPDPTPASRSRNDHRRHGELDELALWKRQVDPRPQARLRVVGGQLGPIFVKARELIAVDEGTLQEVVRCLSTEGGLRRIQELVERDFEALTPSAQRDLFVGQMLPFIEIVTHPHVLASLVVEQAVGTIYNCLYGLAGRRGEPFLRYLASVVRLEIETGSQTTASTYLEQCLLVFWKIVEMNSTAFVHEPLRPVAEQFADLFVVLHGLDGADSLHQARDYLDKLQHRLNIGLSLPAVTTSSKPEQQRSGVGQQPPAAFVTPRQPPGGRHDNDHEYIDKIQIMPTFQEILSPRAEYVPVKDPRQWHIGGLAGLLDRNFRLLREDTIGQLRDAIHAELQPSDQRNSRRQQKSQTRTHMYRQVVVQGVDFHRFAGLQFIVRFAQPPHVRGLAKKKVQEWWQLSKRLQPDALVCLVDPRGSAIFCTVAAADRPRPRAEAADRPQQREKLVASLWDNSQMASAMLQLVEPNENSWQYILACQASPQRQSTLSLVEFPGILLPSFQPTLLALQRMHKAADLPMAEFLAPNVDNTPSTVVDVPPPVYAASHGFSFDLKCLMEDGSSLNVQHAQPVDLERLQRQSTLDDAQAAALVSTLQRRIGLIQGPPGTGKSYTGVALIKVLLANKAKVRQSLGPIICVCYTNHALDQLLEDLLENQITSQIIRIGSQSKSERLQPLNLRTVARAVEKTRLEKSEQWRLHTALDEHEEGFHKLRLNALAADQSLKYYLQRSRSVHYAQLFGQDEEGFQRQTNRKPKHVIHSWLRSGRRGGGHPRSIAKLAQVHVDEMTAEERQALHGHWVNELRNTSHQRAQATFAAHLETRAAWDKIRDEMDLRCLRAADVIGATTTGLARNLEMLRRLQSKVLVCEEAGEVLEAHLLTSLLPSLEHVILIGDHQQLRPQIQNYDLSRESKTGSQYSLDRSLFERLVEPDDGVGIQLPFCTLETQRRMHPSISQLIRDTLYPRLQDAPSVSLYPEVVGMRRRLFWLDHRVPEGNASGEEAMATSHWNDHEIELTIALVNHLLRQGAYQSGDIAVLTPYLGQLHRMRRKLSASFTITVGERDQEDLDNAGFAEEDPAPDRNEKQTLSRSTLLQALRVATIDNFQGEEAKVVVISVVRSNNQNRCGFLRTPNRINVLLSRAKHGMYVLGNSATSRGVEMWGQVLDLLEKDGNLGEALELACPRHPETPILISEPEHFIQHSPEGGCSLPCGKRLQCGHPCKQKCHSEILHAAVFCPAPCPRPLKGCSHPCPRPCGDTCPPRCTVTVFDAERVLPCGHFMAKLPCWQAQDLSLVQCPTLVEREIPYCGHRMKVACHVNIQSVEYQCEAVCRRVLACGHNCKRACASCVTRTATEPVIDHGTCTQLCGRPYSTCAHACATQCHGEAPCPPCAAPCDVQCGHSRCPRTCSEPCAPCAVPGCLSFCPHSSCSMPCAAPCDHVPCSRRCEKPLPCGHQCPSVCGELCPPVKFCQECASEEIRATTVDFILGESYHAVDLTQNPCIFPRCGHFLTIESMDAQMEMRNHYVLDANDRPVAIASSSQPFSMKDIRTCATCRGSLRDVARYGRLVRRAWLDETTKKFILYLNREYVPMAQEELPKCIAQLQSEELKPNAQAIAQQIFHTGNDITINGSPGHQVRLMQTHVKGRWKEILTLRRRISDYKSRVQVEEQPFHRVRTTVEDVRRRQGSAGPFDFDANVLQTKGHLQAAALLLRLDAALLADFLSLRNYARAGSSRGNVLIDLTEFRRESRRLIADAEASSRRLQQVEGHLFLAQFCALERHTLSIPAASTQSETLLQEGTAAVDAAQGLCDRYASESRGLAAEVEGTRAMLRGTEFYTPVTTAERLAVLAAMAREFRGTGHWYYCVNGHPFTIGECGGAMQLSRCPECGAAVGGANHRTTVGVTHARDLEDALQGMHL